MEYLMTFISVLKASFNLTFFFVSTVTVVAVFVGMMIMPIVSVLNFFSMLLLGKKRSLNSTMGLVLMSILAYLLCLGLNQISSLSPVSGLFYELFKDQHSMLTLFLISFTLNILTLMISAIAFNPSFDLWKKTLIDAVVRLQSPAFCVGLTILISFLGSPGLTYILSN